MRKKGTTNRKLSMISNDMQYNAYAQRFAELMNQCECLRVEVENLNNYIRSTASDVYSLQRAKMLSLELQKLQRERDMLCARLNEYVEKRRSVVRNYATPSSVLGFYAPRQY